MKNIVARFAAVAIALIGSSTAFAHDPGLSSANLVVVGERISLVLTFNESDLAGFAIESREALSGRAVSLDINGKTLAPIEAKAITDTNRNVELQFSFARPAPGREVTFRSLLLKDLPFGHRQVFSIREGQGPETSRTLLSAQNDRARFTLQTNIGSVSNVDGFREFLQLGVRHILTGYDHLLFLFALLVMCQSARTAALLITSFTAAHSLTLALSTFGLVNLPSRFVEAAIAASILFVGIENLVRRNQPVRWRVALTFAFGLVHGLGFASVLREMGVANSGVAAVVPLLAFNSGVELGQLAVAAIILPFVWLLRSRDSYIRSGLPACSAAVALAGGYWLLDRTVF